MVGHLRNLLLTQGIPCDVRTPYLAGATGDIPFTECWSQLWITNDADLERASGLLKAVLEREADSHRLWRCSDCREEIEGQFETCWHCGSPRPAGDE
jgi:hypothetical protein